MRLLLLPIILLAFPVLEIWLLVELGGRYGWWLLLYLTIVALLGWRLILDEKILVFTRMMQTLSEGGSPSRALFGSAKNVIAGVLLILPGVISDFAAAVLLLWPSAKAGPQGQPQARSQASPWNSRPLNERVQAANDNVIEGEYRRED